MSARLDLAALLETDWAAIPALEGVRVVATERGLDSVETPTALIRWKTTEREPSAPLRHRRVGLLLTLISPHLNLDLAAPQLEDLTEATLDYLERKYLHGTAEVVGWAGSRLAVDIPVTLIAKKD